MVRRKGFPEERELVIIKVNKVTQFAAWGFLPEYPDFEGMIHISEAAGKWIYDVREVVKEGKEYVAKVVRVDPEKKVVKLSLKRVSKRDAKEKMNAFRKEQRAEKILEMVAKKLGKSLDEAYEEIGFKLQDEFGEMYDGLEEIRKNPKLVEKLKIKKEWAKNLLEVLEKAIQEKEVRIKAEIELKSFESDGIERIKKILENLEKNGISIKYLATPRYLAEIKTTNPKQDEKKFISTIEKLLKEANKLKVEASYKVIE